MTITLHYKRVDSATRGSPESTITKPIIGSLVITCIVNILYQQLEPICTSVEIVVLKNWNRSNVSLRYYMQVNK